jgi:hypothetical protein
MAGSTTVRVQASFGLKKPSDPSNTFAGSQESHVSYAIEADVVGLTKEQIAKYCLDLAKELDQGVKLAVCSSLDVGFVTKDDGSIQVTPVTVPSVPFNARPRGGGQGGGGGRPAPQGGGGGGQFAPPKADVSQQPVLMLDYFKNGQPIAFFDMRPLKASGVYKSNAADLRSCDKFTNKQGVQAFIPVWLTDKNGNPNTWEHSLVAAAEKADTAPF